MKERSKTTFLITHPETDTVTEGVAADMTAYLIYVDGELVPLEKLIEAYRAAKTKEGEKE